jgi:hypothetical protein
LVTVCSPAHYCRLIEGGLPPSEVAGMAVEAIRDDRFWVITSEEFDAAIRARVEALPEGRNPQTTLISLARSWPSIAIFVVRISLPPSSSHSRRPECVGAGNRLWWS